MSPTEPYIGQRRSYGGALCTVRYIGTLANTKGEWLGVEWDDVSRGKHDGQHEGRRIFHCFSSSPTAASFVRPSRPRDAERTLLEAIEFKYAAAITTSDDPARQSSPVANSQATATSTSDNVIEIDGKVVEEVGFDKVQKQLSMLSDLKIVLVDELVVCGIAPRGASREAIKLAQEELATTCPNIVELDVGWNVIETWQDIVDICAPLPKLKILKASGLRLREFGVECLPTNPQNRFKQIEELQMNECLLRPAQILSILSSVGPGAIDGGFQSLKILSLALNELNSFSVLEEENGEGDTGGQRGPALAPTDKTWPSVTTVNLDNNRFIDLSSLPTLVSLFPNISTLSLQGNMISQLALVSQHRFETIQTLNLAGNQISSYSFVDALATAFPNLSSLRISRNPLYDGDRKNSYHIDLRPSTSSHPAASAVPPAPSLLPDSTPYYLTLARIPQLKSLNYTTITARDREEGEIYYLSVAEKEIKQILEEQGSSTSKDPVDLARRRHPRYSALCAKHDRNDILERFLERLEEKPPQPPSAAPTSPPLASPETAASLDLKSYAPGTLGSRLVDTVFYVPVQDTDSASSSEQLHHTTNVTTTVQTFRRPLPTTISVYRLKSLVANHFGLPALRFRLVYESPEYDPVEPISKTRGTDNDNLDKEEEEWDEWGNWDVDDIDDENNNHNSESQEDSINDARGSGGSAPPMYITRDGQRFKKRQTEILDGMRPWGDFLDLDAPDGTRRHDVMVRVEPFSVSVSTSETISFSS
ncbi:hypothetical protein ABEF95_011247 [Exophiala dermatitidis]